MWGIMLHSDQASRARVLDAFSERLPTFQYVGPVFALDEFGGLKSDVRLRRVFQCAVTQFKRFVCVVHVVLCWPDLRLRKVEET